MTSHSAISDLTSELMNLATDFLQLEQDPTEFQLDLLEKYLTTFTALQESVDLKDIDSDLLLEINQTHSKILDRATQIQNSLDTDMNKLKSKGKTIMRYLDILPKRISAFRERKG